MTVCIAVICDAGQTIVAASDKMLSLGSTSGDSIALKWTHVSEDWATMFAGDTTVYQAVLSRVAARLPPGSSINEAAAVFQDEYASARRRKAEQQVLSIYGLSMDEFLHQSSQIDAATVAEIRQRINAVDLGCEFLVFGFDRSDPTNPARIFTIDPPFGDSADWTLNGFSAIGSGAQNALSMLYFYPYEVTTPLSEAVYHLCEAKFMAESAPGVGKDTALFIYKSNGNTHFHSGGSLPLLDMIRERWDREGKPRVPARIARDISDYLRTKGLPLNYMPGNSPESKSGG